MRAPILSILSFTCIAILSCSCSHINVKNDINAYYTRLPFDDLGYTGKYADIVIELPQKGQFIFSREYSYQPYWIPEGGNRFLVDRLIPRLGDGPAERPDKRNICSNAAIVAKTDTSVTVHWRYAPDLTKPSFTDYVGTYNTMGNPSEFYAEYADEYFTINNNGTVLRMAKNGCYKLDDWIDPNNQFTQRLVLASKGIIEKNLTEPKLQNLAKQPIKGMEIKKTPVEGFGLHFKFDEGLKENRRETTESVTNTVLSVSGVDAYWRKGISGTALSFDSYSNAVIFPAEKVPFFTDEISLEAWIAPQEYPFNRTAIVDHLNDTSGFFLWMGPKGEIGFRISVDSELKEVATGPVPLYKWTHVVATYQKVQGLSIYLNGIKTAQKPATGRMNDAMNTDITIGMTRSHTQHPDKAERPITKSFNSNFVFSGLIDEVKIYNRGLNDNEIKAQYETLKPFDNQPLQAWVMPAGPEKSTGFGAHYTNLQYSPEWDGLWRVGNYADIVVTFEDKPWRWVFWRGLNYLASLVTEYGRNGVWASDQGVEIFRQNQCFEHMSDKLCRFSNIRMISSSPARVIVHWRNASVNINYEWPGIDQNGWGIWTDEYWTIYPDGVSMRHQICYNGTGIPIHEMNQHEVLSHPGLTTEDVLLDDAVTTSNEYGETQTWYRSKPVSATDNKNMQYINLNSHSKQFQIGEVGTRITLDLHREVYWTGWNHYPVQLIPSDGTAINQNDRPTSRCPATFREVRHQLDEKTVEAMQIYGLTKARPDDLTALNRSWNFPPEIMIESGCSSLGYQKNEKAYHLVKEGDSMKFRILATEESPVVNPAFVIKNWENNNMDNIELKINNQVLTNTEHKIGLETDTDGSFMLIIWLKYTTASPMILEIIC
jgi:hypothetical protein